MKASETPPEHVCPHPKLVQLISHAGEIYALDDHGDLFRHARDPKDFNSGPHNQPKFMWYPVAGPHAPPG